MIDSDLTLWTTLSRQTLVIMHVVFYVFYVFVPAISDKLMDGRMDSPTVCKRSAMKQLTL